MRKELTYTITDEGRDKGKVFKLTEMGADPAERWALRLIFAMMNAGIEMPDDIESMGMAGLLVMGLRSLGKIPYPLAEPLLDELMGCVSIIPDPGKPNVVRSLIESDIEEVKTRLMLKKEVFDLHTGFFTDAEA